MQRFIAAAHAFQGCTSLTSVSIGNSVTSIGDYAFSGCTGLGPVYFQGNAPSMGGDVFGGADRVTVYYLPGTTGWDDPWFVGRPTVVWENPAIMDGTLAVQANAFGFTIAWAPDVSVVVEASPTLTAPTWAPVSTNVLTGGVSEFSDPDWTRYAARFYRLRSP